jgi:hypothetical protein
MTNDCDFPATIKHLQGYQEWVSSYIQLFKRREEMNDKTTWEFGTRQVVYGAIGAALYGVFSWATNIFPLPAAGNISFRPAVAVLIFFGVAYGPWLVCWLASSAIRSAMPSLVGASTGTGAWEVA